MGRKAFGNSFTVSVIFERADGAADLEAEIDKILSLGKSHMMEIAFVKERLKGRDTGIEKISRPRPFVRLEHICERCLLVHYPLPP
jgi:hypothetical protein